MTYSFFVGEKREHELEVEVTVTPGDPGCRTMRNGDPGWPPSGPEIEYGDVRLIRPTKLGKPLKFRSRKVPDAVAEKLIDWLIDEKEDDVLEKWSDATAPESD